MSNKAFNNYQTLSRKGHVRCALNGKSLLLSPQFNKGSAFTQKERIEFKLHSLLPPAINTLDQQVLRVKKQFESKTGDLNRNTFLASLKDQNQVLYFKVLQRYIKEMLSIVYTPTEGEAIEQYSHIFRRPDGCFITIDDADHIEERLAQWGSAEDIDYIVVTDGEEILGIGDQGVGGIGISTAKLVLMTLCAGIHPNRTLPIVLDVGTDNDSLRNDDQYLGLRQRRPPRQRYDEFLEKFQKAVKACFPHALLHFEDFGVTNARRLLQKYSSQLPCFNDDIQGTGAVTLGALTAALWVTKKELKDAKILIYGGGSAGTGICDQITEALKVDGVKEKEARSKIFLIDKQGLLTEMSEGLSEGQSKYARPKDEKESQNLTNLKDIVTRAKPDILIGCSTQARAFTQEVIQEMQRHTKRPIVFPLSNPTRLHEAIPEDIYRWTNGMALVATGSPFEPVEIGDKTKIVAECNNALVYPGIGLGCVVARVSKLSNEMLYAAAKALATTAPALQNPDMALLPDVEDVRKVSLHIAVNVVKKAVEQGLATTKDIPNGDDQLKKWIEAQMWQAEYVEYDRVDVKDARVQEMGSVGVGSL